MQVDRVGRVADVAQNGALVIVGVGQHRQRLVAVRGDDDVVVGLAAAVAVVDDDAMRGALDRRHRATKPQAVAKGRGQLLDIAVASALDRAPDRPIVLQQPVIAEERDEILGGKVEHLRSRSRPDRGPHRGEVIGQKPRREMTLTEIVAERQSRQPSGLVVLDALIVEGQDVAQHPEIRGRKQVSPLREQSLGGLEPVVAAAFPLEAAAVGRDRKAHAAFDRLDLHMVEQRGELGVVQFIVDDEADIDGDRLAVIVDRDGMAVSAGAEFAVIDRHRVTS